MSNEGIELAVYAPDLTTFLGNLPRRWDPTFLEEHNRDGAGSFKIRADDQVLVDNPTLLNEGNMVRHTVDGGQVHWWEILRRKDVLVSDGEYAGLWTEYSGPGIRNRLSHGVVYPEYGLVKNPDDRAFNFASKQGAWYAPAQWVAPVAMEYAKPGGSNWAGLEEWPLNLSAQWIWDRNSTSCPKGDVYVRHEFSLSTARKLKLFASADDLAVFLIDGARVLTISEWGAWKNVFTADIELSAGNHVFAAKGVNTSVSKAGLVYALVDMTSEPENDDAITNAMRIIRSGAGGLINAYPAVAPGWNVGQIFNQLLDEAVARGCGTLASLTRGFTTSADSYGVPWPRTFDMVFSLGDSLSNVASKLCDGYVDIWMTGNQINMAPSRGVDRSVPIGAKDPVSFRDGLSVLGAESESQAEISNVAVMETNSGLVERVGPAGSISQFGRRETFLSATNGSESGTAGVLADQLFTKYSMPRRTPTLDIFPTPGNVPWVDFGVGDWILAPDDNPASTALIKRRIVSLSVTENTGNGEPVYAAEIDTIQSTTEERLSRWLLAVENGTKAGGLAGTSSAGSSVAEIVKTGAGTGNPPLPSVPSQANPTAPTAVTATSDVYLDELKVQRGKLTVGWAHDGKDVTGRDLAAVRYEMTYRPTGSSQPWVVAAADNTKTGIIAPLRILKADLTTAESYTVAVRAVGVNGRTSDWSQAIDVTMLKDTTAPQAPYFPTTGVTTWLRTATVRWNGKLTDSGGTVQNDPPADFSHINVYQSTSAAGAGRTKVGRIEDANGLWATDKLTAGTAAWFQLTAVDKSGNESAYSTARSITPQANVDLTEITNAIDGATITITNLGASSIKDKAILTSKLDDNAVVMAKIDTAVQAEIAKGQTALNGLSTTNSNLSTLSNTVDGKNTIVNSTANASGTTGYVTGDRWQKWDTLATGGKLLASWRYNGSAWLQESIDPVYIPQIDIGTGTFGSLAGGRIIANSVTATELLLSRGANMHVDPEFKDTAWWSTSAGAVTISQTGGKNGKGSALIAQNSSQSGTYYASTTMAAEGPKRRARVVEGTAYKIGAWVQTSASAPANSISIYPRWFKDADGTNALGTSIKYRDATGTAIATPAGTWVYVSGFTTCPAGYDSLTLGLYKESGYTTGTTLWSDPSIQPAADANLIVQGSVYAEHVNAQSVAGAVGSFLTINVSQLNATSANMGSAVIDKLWTDVVQSRKISTSMLEVTGENLISNGSGEFGNNTNWSDWTYSTQVPTNSGAPGSFTPGPTTVTRFLANNQGAWPVDGDAEYVLEGWIKADVTGSKTYLEFMEDNGVNPTPQYALANYDVPTVWTKFSVPVKTSPGQKSMRVRMFANHTNGSVTTAWQYLTGLRFRKKITSDVIVDGGIVAKHITASEEMWTKVLGAHKINAGEINTNSLTSDTGFVGSMRTNILTSDVVQSSMIHATNGITSKHTITGATIQTATSGRRVKLDSGGMTAYDGAGVVVISQNTTTGDMIMRGNILSRTTNGNSLWLGADMTESGAVGAPQRAGLIFGSTATETASAALYRDGTYGALRMDSPRSAGSGGVTGGSVVMASNSGIFGWAYRDADVAGPSVSATQKFYIGVDNNWFIGGGRPETPDYARISGNSTNGEIFIVRHATHRMNFAADRSTFLDTSRFDIAGPLYANAKNFRIPHPTQPGMDLIHTATESPMVGVEYWGEGVVGPGGTVEVELPEYFEALVRERNRAVLLTCIDNLSLISASQISGGKFTVNGEEGQRFSWLVKAERADVEFDVVQPSREMPAAPEPPVLEEQPIEQDDTPPFIPENPPAPAPEPDTIDAPTDEMETSNGSNAGAEAEPDGGEVPAEAG